MRPIVFELCVMNKKEEEEEEEEKEEEKEEERRIKKDNKVKIFKFSFLSF